MSSSFILFSFVWLNATSGCIMFYFQVIFIWYLFSTFQLLLIINFNWMINSKLTWNVFSYFFSTIQINWKPNGKSLARRSISPAVYSSLEYSQWMTRAPSTSAIYDSVRRLKGIQPLSHSSLSKIAHSAESLLDTIRMVSKLKNK